MSEIKRWAASGISIDANELDVEALARFATLALQEFPESTFTGTLGTTT